MEDCAIKGKVGDVETEANVINLSATTDDDHGATQPDNKLNIDVDSGAVEKLVACQNEKSADSISEEDFSAVDQDSSVKNKATMEVDTVAVPMGVAETANDCSEDVEEGMDSSVHLQDFHSFVHYLMFCSVFYLVNRYQAGSGGSIS